MDFSNLIDAVALRGPSIRGGILPASAYLGAVSSCMADGQCAAKWANICTPAEWMRALKESARKLTYTDPDMAFLGKAADYKPKTPNAVMDFDCILTSTRKDRDGDVLESEGAEVDPRMPLLWQHVSMSPIGRMVEMLSQGKDRVVIHCAIADTELGRDAAVLVEFGALRISHGFKPLKFEPLARGQGEGFHILKYEVMEVSLVSVASNTDAVITAFSRQKLHHPFVKAFAAGLWTRKPELVAGGWTKEADACNGQCVRHLAKRFRKRLAKGKYPGRKSMKALHKMVKQALDENMKSLIFALAKEAEHDPSPNSCICSVYSPDSPMKPDMMCQKLCAALALGRVHTKTLNALDRALKKARKATKKKTTAVAAPLERGTVEHRRVAWHETGHCLVAHLLGVLPARASVGSKDCANAGFNGTVHVDSKLREALPPSEQLLLYIAGFASEKWAGFHPRERSGQPDQKKALKLYKRLAGRRPTDGELSTMIERVTGMFRDPEIYKAATRVQSLLSGCARGEASGEEIDRAIKDGLGENRARAVELVRAHAKDLVRLG